MNEIYSIIIETMKYVSNPSSWSSDLPLLLWHRKDPPVIQIVDDGDDIITISYHINSAGDHITIDLFRNSLAYLQIMYSRDQIKPKMESFSPISISI